MRNVILSLQLSLDGYMADSSGQPDFVTNSASDTLHEYVTDVVRQSDTVLFGRVSYEEQAGHWPTATGELADLLNSHTKIVFSSTLKHLDWQNSRLATQLPTGEIAQLKSQPGKDIFVSGGARLAQSLLREGLIDELMLYIHPIVLGGGLPLFVDRQELALANTLAFDTGVVLHTYTAS